MKTQGRAAASTLFVIGLGMLWAAGFAPSLATVVGEGISSLVVPILSGATVAALGVAQCCGAALERGPKLALAAAVALRLGVPPESIKKSVARLNSVAHRQQLLYNGLDVIIDDAYNANEAGARSALRLLGGFRGKTRVLVTPGIVELGISQYDANYELGAYAASRADVMIFIGSNARALASGAESGGAAKTAVFEVGSLKAATEILKNIKGERAILFENDLPDNYR